MSAPEPLTIANASLRLTFTPGRLRAENLRAGSAWSMACPGFGVQIAGDFLAASDFLLESLRGEDQAVTCALTHPASGLRATVRYWLQGEEPWFRQQVTLSGASGLPPPERLWVDRPDLAGQPVRRVGYGVRGGLEREEIEGTASYAQAPACGYPVYVGDWFVGLEHPTGFAVPTAGVLELFQHPTWDAAGEIVSFPAVYGAAPRHEAASAAFMDYLWAVRHPRLEKPLTVISVGWSSVYQGDGEYLDTFEGREAFCRAMDQLGLRPKAVGIDAGWFDRRSLYRGKGDDDQDTRLIAFREWLQSGLMAEGGCDLAVWVSHNGHVGFDLDWIKEQGWEVGPGPGAAYTWHDYVVMMQPDFEAALTRRWEEIVGRVGAVHLKMDWDNECATNERFSAAYPTVDHVREASVKAMNRVDARLRAVNPGLKTRHGWWPSPWWLLYADHVWLADSGDCEYAAWPSRTARDRDATHRDAMYDHITRVAETPLPLDAIDNHGFAQALGNCFTTDARSWLNTCLLSALRGTTYIHYPLTPEGIRDWQAEMLQQVLDWWDYHAAELGTPGTRLVLGRPAWGEVYGFLHPGDTGAWLLLRNPSVEPQMVVLPLEELLGYQPATARQVHPYWADLPLAEPAGATVGLLGHELALLRLSREALPEINPHPPHEFMLENLAGTCFFTYPSTRQVSDTMGPLVHPDMQIPALTAEPVADGLVEGVRRLQWFIGVPHRLEQAEILVTLRGPEALLDGLSLRAGTSRYRGDGIRDHTPVTRLFRGEPGYGLQRVLPPPGPRERDDYVFAVPDGGYTGVTVEVRGPGCGEVLVETWLTGYEATARWWETGEDCPRPMKGPLLPMHPYGFPRWLRL